MAIERERPSVIDFHTELVLPALMQRLDQAFPEFGWRRDPRGWVATNQQHTHARLGVRADRVIAHEPQGFLVHGGEAMLWTAYLNDGNVPHGADFVRAVTELAARAGVDPSPIERQARPDRRSELLETFFELARRELSGEGGAHTRAYLERRDFPSEAINDSGLGVVPPARITHEALADIGYRDPEIKAAGVLADTRWPGRLCGAWRNEWGKIGTFWARAADDHVPREGRYLYLRGASRTNLPPYGFPGHTRELVLVEGFFDHHQLAARGVENVAALGGTSTSPRLFERLSRRGVETVVLCFDNDDAGRFATAKAVEHAAGAPISPAIYVVSPDKLDAADDPDALIRRKGLDGWKELLESRECGVAWRAKEILAEISPAAAIGERREALRRAGTWLGTLPPRLAIEQEDAVRTIAARTGYTPDAVGRAFRARYWDDGQIERTRQPELEQSTEPEL